MKGKIGRGVITDSGVGGGYKMVEMDNRLLLVIDGPVMATGRVGYVVDVGGFCG